MDRREFLKTAAAGAAAAGVAACAPGITRNSGTEEGRPSLEGTMEQHTPGIGLLGYGCMRWPMIKDESGNNVIDQEAVNELVDMAISHGVNYFDSAPVYLGGQSERATGIALNRYPREKWLLATKASNMSNFSKESAILMYQNSLKNFETDHIDYYLLHNLSGEAAFKTRFIDNGLLDYLLKEKELGHIRNLGFSFHGNRQGFDEMMALHDTYHWDFVQIQMNYMDWTHSGGSADAQYMYAELDKREIPIVIMEPLRGGGLSNVPASVAEDFKRREPSRSVASWAFRFVGSFPRVQVVLSGMTYMEHLLDNLDTYLDFKPLTQEELDFLELTADNIQKFPLIGCTGCEYCMPCPYGINIPGIFKFYNDNVNAGTYVYSSEQEGYERARKKNLLAYNKAIPTVRQADHCISCGKCIRECPQRIRIPQQLQRINDYIEQLKQETL